MNPRFLALCIAFLQAALATAQPIEGDRVVYAEDKEVFVAALDGSLKKQLTSNGLIKFKVRWSPGGERISFFERTEPEVAKARLVVMDLEGQVQQEVLIHPGPERWIGMRFIEHVTWLDDTKILLSGSANPYNCEYQIVDVATGKTIQHGGACDTHAASPDGMHFACLDTISPGPDSQRRDSLRIDAEIAYRDPSGGVSNVRIPAGPVWNPTGTAVAVVERSQETGEKALVVVGLDGSVKRHPILVEMVEADALAWVADEVIFQSGNDALVFHPASGHLRAAGDDEMLVFAARDRAKARAEARAKADRELAKENGWNPFDIWREPRDDGHSPKL